MSKAIPLILLLLFTGCGPRWETAREQVLAQIDSLLDTIDLRSRLATASVAELETGVNQLSHARIDVAVRHTRLTEDLDAVQEKIARTQEGLSRQALQVEAESLRTTRDRLARVLTLLRHREEQARDRLQALRLLLSQIDSKRIALKSLRKAVEVCESGTLDFKSVEAEIKELEAQIDGELEFQEIRLSDLSFDWD